MSEDKDFQMDDSFADFVNELEKAPQPTCNLENPEDCEACGS
jgi:hypothetical protein